MRALSFLGCVSAEIDIEFESKAVETMGEGRDTRFEDCEFFATCPPGVEGLLADELRGLGVRKVRPLAGGAAFYGKPAAGLRVCLWSRLI